MQVYMNFGRVWSVPNQKPCSPRIKMLTSKLQRHSSNLWEIWITYKKKPCFPKLQKSEEILEIRKKLKFSFSEFRKNRFDNFTKPT